MNIHLPIYVEQLQTREQQGVYVARPLFFSEPVVRGEKLERLMARLARDLAQKLGALGRAGRHEELAAYTFYPRLQQHRLDIDIALRRRTARCRFLFISFRQLGRRIVFTPSLPELWFDLKRGEALPGRATEVLTAHFRDLEREDEGEDVNPKSHALSGTAYITSLEFTVRTPVVPPAPKQTSFLFLGDETPVSGAQELRRVGRCLDWQYPDDLDRVLLRDGEVEELTGLLQSEERRPVLLVGPRQVGKTAILHEYVWRQVSGRRSAFLDRSNVWLLAPARLISGMSYVGQWENRLLAILKEAKRRRHILYFDDLIGLFLAGQSAVSSLSVADVLKPYLERRQVQVVGEITPDALRVLRERDRGFADLFHLLPVREPKEEEILRILIFAQRQLETQHRCRFELDVLPTVLDLQRRYARDLAFPGKAATFLRQLAVKFSGTPIFRGEALEEFRLRSGLSTTFLDRQMRLERRTIRQELAKHVIGQEAALEAAADVLSIAKARLNDPGRPLGVFLFLGPTGVGKTECAKAIAQFLFQDDDAQRLLEAIFVPKEQRQEAGPSRGTDRLLRFDLNEYNEPGAAARLVGTFHQPEGLLTSAIRRQPFAVVLFDEVEKAHPEVFDMLLQVLGEGRLTDALGRTADFSNALIVLTSNLGVRESESSFGLRSDDASRDSGFVRAAEKFFRPEFFNRIDRIIPFHRLDREQVRSIARKLLAEIFSREGLMQRKCLLSVETPALERIVDQGYDPVLGARALKRSLERHLVQPVGTRLAALPPGGFTLIRVYPGPDTLAVNVQALEEVPRATRRTFDPEQIEEVLRGIRAAVRRIEDDFAVLRPEEPVTLGQVQPEHYRYFTLRDQAEQLRVESEELAEEIDLGRRSVRGMPTMRQPDTPRRSWKSLVYLAPREGRLLREVASAYDINEYLADLTRAAQPSASRQATVLQHLLNQSALLQLLAECVQQPQQDHVLLWPLLPDGTQDSPAVTEWLRHYHPSLEELGLACESLDIPDGSCRWRGLGVHGPHSVPLLAREVGLHLFCPAHGAVLPIAAVLLPIPEGVSYLAVMRTWLDRRAEWLGRLGRGESTVAEDPLAARAVIRLYTAASGVFDLRTGLTGNASLEDCLLTALPLPAEVDR
jgi:ATP-dependent Clp protease ATP-binding subunit ClpA